MAEPESGPSETELKFALHAAEALGLEARMPAGGTTRGIESVYYDTPGEILRRHGLTLRVRRDGDRRVQTVKAARQAGIGLFDRTEWEWEIAGDGIDFACLDETPAGRLLRRKHRAERLRPAFESLVSRTTWLLVEDGSEIEVALDVGRVEAGDRHSPVRELELELKRGRPDALFALAARLADGHAFRLGATSKSARGYALLAGPDGSGAVKAESVLLLPEMSAAESFRRIARSCLHQFRANEDLLVATRDAEALHQARVALRRLRAALSLFRDVVADAEIEGLKAGLRAISRRLGEARNLDVYLAATLPPDDPELAGPGGPEYRDLLGERREAAYDDLARELEGAAFCNLALSFLRWLETGAWLTAERPSEAPGEQTVSRLASGILDRRFRQVRRRGRHLAELDPAARHQVRIAAKKLRYAAEFFSGLVDGRAGRRRVRAFLDALKALQDILGDLNDIQVGHELAASLAADNPARPLPDGGIALFAAGRVSERADERIGALLDDAQRAHRRLARAKPFWPF